MKFLIVALLVLATGCSDDAVQSSTIDATTVMPPESDMSLDSSDVGTDAHSDMSQVSPQGPDEAIRSGTRLKRRYFESVDGTQNSGTLLDSQLGVPCRFVEFDSDFRCLPLLRSVVYPDNSCTSPLGRFPQTCGDSSSSFYTDGQTVYRADGAFEFEDEFRRVYARQGSSCSESTVFEESTQLVELEPLAIANFMRGDRVIEERSENMEAHFIEAEDGSRVLLGVYHAELGYRCDFDSNTCLPRPVNPGRFFGDSGCQDPLYEADPEQRYGFLRDAELCPTEIHELILHEGKTYTKSVGECVETTTATPLVAAGERIEISGLPEVSERLEGDGRLLASRLVDSEGRAVSRQWFFDRELEVDCTGGYVGQPDSFRCHPGGFHLFSEGFVDSACETPGEAFSTPLLCGDEPEPVVSDVEWELVIDGCLPWALPVRKTVRSGDPVTLYRSSQGGSCEEASEEYRIAGEDVTDELGVLNLETEN